MNSSQPVASHLDAVSFGFLTSADTRSLSVKRITSPTTFDTLLNPVPGGLYDAALGQFGDNACATCGLKTPQCPGHCGHVELPVPCYHPTFMDQVLRLMRATCVYCSRLKMPRVEVSRFSCKLRLVKYGLLKEIYDLDEISPTSKATALSAGSSDEESDDEISGDVRDLIGRRERFTKQAIRQAREDGRLSTHKTEAIADTRRLIVKEFLASVTKGKKCGNCGGISPSYRKDRYTKMFRKPLSEKERLAMIQQGKKAVDPLILLRNRDRAKRKRQPEMDEAVADLEHSSEEEEEEDEDEPEVAGGDELIVGSAVQAKTAKGASKAQEQYLTPTEVHAQLVQLFERDQDILSLVYGQPLSRQKGSKSPVSADMFFLRDLLVPPNRYRPATRTGSDEIAEAQENTLYKNILSNCETMAQITRELNGTAEQTRYRLRTYQDFQNAWTTLQDHVNSLIDRDRNPLQGAAGKRNPDGVKQKLEKKEGMFRKYMMGKRVNFAARTVLSPDPNIETNEIGVPPVFAVKLTYPEPVNVWNLEELQEAVRNGPFVWPGALAIESENGSVVKLERKNAEERTALANQLLAPTPGVRGTRPKKVHRHLNNGDVVIMNRQPTLHKPSMMCHRARVLPGEKTLRMHYANCHAYNADFDGDEMNMHFPQNEVARAEALTIADTDHQYLSGTAGNPLRGLIQDHISICVWLTNRDTFFTRDDYMQLLYAALRPESGHCASGRLETVTPAVVRPRKLWTGKQVVTSVLKNITPPTHQGLTMSGKSKTGANMWGSAKSEEQDVLFQDGELLCGILDKQQIGPSSGSFVNGVYEAYGHTVAGRLLSVLGRLLTKMLHMKAFSCGVEDLIFTRRGEETRREKLSGAETVGLKVAAKYVTLQSEKPDSGDKELRRRLEDVLRDESKQIGLDAVVSNATKDLSSAVTSACLPDALVKPFPKNQMQTMTASGAKGSSVNANQISCNLGQQVLEGRRVPVMVSGKTLPCFKPFESSVRAGGYVVDRFLTGVRPQEFFFHAMAGREGLIDTAVKTSRSGYLQRCLIKGLEGLKVEYDTSVRDADGSVVQFLYGEDGLDVGKAKYLSDFKFAAENYLSLFHSFGMLDNFERVMSTEAREYNKSAIKKVARSGDVGASDPALAVWAPSKYAGSTSEKMYEASKSYVDTNPDKVIKDKKKGISGASGLTKKNFQAILDIKYLKSVVEAGEAVGVVAAQSVGEPSTQMTLNTFHLAGHAARNVTLGIPRLREILMTAASNIGTPMMTVRVNEEISKEQAEKFAKGISRLSLAEIMDKVTVTESTGKGTAYGEARRYQIRMDLYPAEEYCREYAIKVEDVISTIEHKFLPRLQSLARKELKKRGEEKSLKAAAKSDALPDIGKSSGTVQQERSRPEGEADGGDDDSDADGDEDATKDKSKSNKAQAGYEAYEDEEENDIAKQAREREATPEAEEDRMPEDEAYGGSEASEAEEEIERKKAMSDNARDREQRIKSEKRTNDIASFSFDDKTGSECTFTFEYAATTAKMLMLHLVERAAHDSLIQSIPGISLCLASIDKATWESEKDEKGLLKGHLVVSTSGVNIPAMWDYQHVIHPHYLRTNSVSAMLQHYGVEAARATIVLELQAVFGGHGISVDVRHLGLIADYMTRNGEYQAFSRMGFRGNPSPFMKMSFETTVGFLSEAVLAGDEDDLRGASARIVTGQVGKVGTGGFDVFLPLKEGNEVKADVDVASIVVDEVDDMEE